MLTLLLLIGVSTSVLASDESNKPQLTPSAKFDETLRLRIKHDVMESVSIIKKQTDVKKARSLVDKVLATVINDMDRLRKEQLLQVPANPESLVTGSLTDADIEAYVNLATNLLVFSNVALYQPDLCREYLKKDSKNADKESAISLVKWAISYCRDTNMFTNHTKAENIVKLMEQELEFVPRDENYQNPYSHRHKVEKLREEFEQKQKELEKNKDKAKKSFKKDSKKSKSKKHSDEL